MALNPASSSSPAAPRTNTAPSANRQIEANKRAIAALETELDGLQARHNDLQNQYDELQSRSKDHERVLNARLQNLETKLQVLLTGMKRVKTTAIEKRAVEEEAMGGDEQEGASGETDGDVVDEEGEAAAVARSVKAAENYLPISKAIERCISHLSNTEKATPAVLLREARYPPEPLPPDTTITYNDDAWPTDPRSTTEPREKVFRLNFLAPDGFDDVQNTAQIDRLLTNILTTGGARNPAAKDLLQDIQREHLRPLVRKKFQYIAQEQRNLRRRVQAATASVTAPEAEDEEDEEEHSVKLKSTPQEQNSIAKSFLTALKRKRAAIDLNSDAAKYKQSKYDAAFRLSSMPFHEECDIDGKKGFRVHRPSWWSDEMRELFDALEAIPDTAAAGDDKSKPRIRGPDVEKVPAKAKSLESIIFTWQVDVDVLESHPEWYNQRRVASSGSEWDEDEPEPIETKKRKATNDGRSAGSKRVKEELLNTLEVIEGLAEDVEKETRGTEKLARAAVQGRSVGDMFSMEELVPDEEEDDDGDEE